MFSFSKPHNPSYREMIEFASQPSAASAADPEAAVLDLYQLTPSSPSLNQFVNDDQEYELNTLLSNIEEGRGYSDAYLANAIQRYNFDELLMFLSEITDAREFLIREKKLAIQNVSKHQFPISMSSMPCLIVSSTALAILVSMYIIIINIANKIEKINAGNIETSRRSPAETYEIMLIVLILAAVIAAGCTLIACIYALNSHDELKNKLKYSALPNTHDMVLKIANIELSPDMSVNEVIKRLTEKEVELRNFCVSNNLNDVLENLHRNQSSYVSRLSKDVLTYIIGPMLFTTSAREIEEKIRRSQQSTQSHTTDALNLTGNVFQNVPVLGRYLGV